MRFLPGDPHDSLLLAKFKGPLYFPLVTLEPAANQNLNGAEVTVLGGDSQRNPN